MSGPYQRRDLSNCGTGRLQVAINCVVTPHAQRERGKVIDRDVHIYIYYVCGRKKYLNRTLEIDSPFQTLTVGLLVEFID